MANSRSSIAAFFGGITVVASLLLVAWEIRQNTLAQSAQALQSLNMMSNETTLLVADNPQLATILMKGSEDLESLSSAEYRQYSYFYYAVAASFEAAHGFYSKGLLDETDFSGWRRSSCGLLRKTTEGAKFWELQRDSFSDKFIAFIETECVP